ncbi:gp16 family protein [Sphingopyxis alaskensis]|uniref:gp16 family protein n=1 Tax=Sphingopyxis alaskensis TaxID=117207 RepID=UPI00203E4CFB|nr:regulatory protein GemA [Sphingopyxis alaskensis]MCM3419032.1 regulatory protein GemA [Sphingopyxis alaskensis]
MTAPARQTSIDPSQQRRRALLAKVHIAKKQLGLAEDDYRAIIFQHCRSMSAADATEAQLAAVVQHFAQRGFKAAARSVPGRKAPAVDTPSARKARALWLSLHQLGAVRNPSEHALEAFARRQLGVEQWRWSDQSLSYRLIEALKAMALRHGWEVGDGKHIKLHASKARLVRAILAKLVASGIAHPGWTVTDALFRLTGEEIRPIDLSLSLEELTRAAHLLGRVLAERSSQISPEA